jgi:hypothetical protein
MFRVRQYYGGSDTSVTSPIILPFLNHIFAALQPITHQKSMAFCLRVSALEPTGTTMLPKVRPFMLLTRLHWPAPAEQLLGASNFNALRVVDAAAQ